MPKHCMTAVIECFLINAHHLRAFAIENSAEIKYWLQFISLEGYVSIILNILIGCQNLLNLAVGFKLLVVLLQLKPKGVFHGTPSGSTTNVYLWTWLHKRPQPNQPISNCIKIEHTFVFDCSYLLQPQTSCTGVSVSSLNTVLNAYYI